jgi:outer membrane biosynthesis protein TonB
MLDKIIGLFERLVVAVEKNATNQEAFIAFQRELADRDCTYVAAPEAVAAPEEKKTTKTKKEKVAEPKKEEPAKPADNEPEVTAPKPTLADVKAAVAGYAKNREGKSAAPKDDARALMAAHADGATSTATVAEQYYEAVIAACAAGWAPAEQEEDL